MNDDSKNATGKRYCKLLIEHHNDMLNKFKGGTIYKHKNSGQGEVTWTISYRNDKR